MDLRVPTQIWTPESAFNAEVNADDESGLPELQEIRIDGNDQHEAAADEKKHEQRAVPDVQWDPERGAIVGDFNPVLAVRLLQHCFDPEVVQYREDFRKQNRSLYWPDLSEIERLSMTEWAVCDLCTETSWCVRKNRQQNALLNTLCQHCFYLDGIRI